MRVLLTGATGAIGSRLLPRLEREGHDVRALARRPERLPAHVDTVKGDLLSGDGLEAALDGADAAYYLIHSMETVAAPADTGAVETFADRDRRAASAFAAAAERAGVGQIVYLGGLVPAGGPESPHLRSRLEVEEILLAAAPRSTALRASIVIDSASRSFRFLVRLVERLPVLLLPAWQRNRTQPIDGRDTIELLARAITTPAVAGRSLDIAGPDLLTYGEMMERIAEHLMVARPAWRLGLSMTAVESVVSAAIAGEDPDLIGPLMSSLGHDLLPRETEAARLMGVRLHSFDSAVERALRDWEATEQLAAR
jgi:uncharacterized protein YbjT (DUF2867 family)